MSRLLNRDAATVLREPRIWIKIPMPPGVPALHHAIGGIVLHAMTASNVFARNQTVQFQRDGTSIPVTRSGGTAEHLVAPLTVMSTTNDPYEAAATPSASAMAAIGQQSGECAVVRAAASSSRCAGCDVVR